MCEYCETSRPIIEVGTWQQQGFGQGPYDEEPRWIIIDRGYLRYIDPVDCCCIEHGDNQKINYCPMCGRDLNGK